MRRVLKPRTLSLLVFALALTFLFLGANFDFDYVIPKRLARLAAIVIGGVCVAVSSIVFQTIAGNRILTPAVMGYEAVYLLLQSPQPSQTASLITTRRAGSGNLPRLRRRRFSAAHVWS